MKELVRTEENSTKEAIIAYDNSKTLQSVLTIEGVILALLIPSVIYAKDWDNEMGCSTIAFMAYLAAV